MDTTTTPPDGGTVTPTVKKKPTPVGKYKSMVKPAAADTSQLMVQKADGSIGPWGNDITPPKKPATQTTGAPQLSDKAKGYSNNYYTPNH